MAQRPKHTSLHWQSTILSTMSASARGDLITATSGEIGVGGETKTVPEEANQTYPGENIFPLEPVHSEPTYMQHPIKMCLRVWTNARPDEIIYKYTEIFIRKRLGYETTQLRNDCIRSDTTTLVRTFFYKILHSASMIIVCF